MSMTSLQRFLQNIREQIELDEVQAALDQLESFLNDGPPKLRNELSLHMVQLNRLYRQERMGIIPYDVAQSRHAQLRNSLFEFLDEIAKYTNQASAPAMPATIKNIEQLTLPESASLEKILGTNNLKQISWIQQGIKVAKSVCRILTPTGRGTGFLIGANRLMTNNHVIATPEIAQQSFAEFNYEQDGEGEHLPTYRFRLNPAIFHTSPINQLDYTIVGIDADPNVGDLEQWGCLTLNPNAKPVTTEHVIIIQHPNGGLKQIAMTANQVVNTQNQYLYYTTDTMPGSSGSPVFNDLWQVIAIHHADGGLKKDPKGVSRYVNEGILMSQIKPDAGDDWPTD